ncbi:hypothetical protein [Ammoniphilus sp. YIM 78166]|uniref:hypothetical protein n=1 Tax=Ammoniphilus sp. YIM 78166 TaxID=1644106 RepID=UPI00106F61D3|nr:hypothetical protein [Ammoniphilus sp. YIM 78166]
MSKKKSIKKMRAVAKQLKGKPMVYMSKKGQPFLLTIEGVKGDKAVIKANRMDPKKVKQVGFPGLGAAGPALGGLGGIGGALGGLIPLFKLFSLFGPGLLKGLGGLGGAAGGLGGLTGVGSGSGSLAFLDELNKFSENMDKKPDDEDTA